MNRRISETYTTASSIDVENGQSGQSLDRYASDHNHTDIPKPQSFMQQLRSLSVVSGLVFVWYFFAVVSITTSKQILNVAPYPYTLCTMQFTLAFIISRSVAVSMKMLRPLDKAATPLLVAIAVTYSLGFIFTNLAFSIVPASFAETVKSSEPITSVIFGYVFYSEFLSMKAYATLLPICIGVATSCFSNDDFSLSGFLLAALSNVFFSARAVLSKVLVKNHPEALNEISLFAYISGIGVFVSLPFALFFDLSALYGPEYSQESLGMLPLVILYVLNGLAYSTYNLMSFMVLMRVNIATHAVLNVFRRVFIIVFTSLYFGNKLSYLNIFGIALSVLGVLTFNFTRQPSLQVEKS